jgi:hypothetical protein
MPQARVRRPDRGGHGVVQRYPPRARIESLRAQHRASRGRDDDDGDDEDDVEVEDDYRIMRARQ